MEDVIKTILYEWKIRKIPEIIQRELQLSKYLKIQPPKIIAITGFRRVGKTFLLLQLISELLKSYDKEEVIYINFEDERIPQKTEFLSKLLPVIKNFNKKPIKYLFLDEVQDIPLWSKWLRRIYDTENIQIFITGSSSKVSSKEIPTELRGRCIEFNLFPLTFNEFLKFKNTQINIEALKFSEEEKIKLENLLEEYVIFGGMPEIVLISEENKIELLQEYYRTVLRKDIIERFKIKNEEGLSALVKLLINSTYFSISKMYNNLKSVNYEIGKGTLQRYVSYLEDSYFFHQLLVFSPKIKHQLQTNRKIYFIDNGFINALSVKFTRNFGRLYENSVFLELERRFIKKGKIYFWKNSMDKEVDFVIKENFDTKQLIQVCYNIDDEMTEKREVSALLIANKELSCDDMIIITKNYEAEKKIKNKTIKYIPLWKWFLT